MSDLQNGPRLILVCGLLRQSRLTDAAEPLGVAARGLLLIRESVALGANLGSLQSPARVAKAHLSCGAGGTAYRAYPIRRW
jgi:hypothetical protein